MVDVRSKGADAEQDAELAPELERDLVPVPAAAASAIVEPPSAPRLELSEVGPNSAIVPAHAPSTDVAPPPPAVFDEGATSSAKQPDVEEPAAVAKAAPSFPPIAPATAELGVEANGQATPVAPSGLLAEAVSAVPTPSSRPPALAPRPPSLVSAKRRSPAVVAAIWIATATVPAAAVWFMRTPKHEPETALAARTTVEYRAQTVQTPPRQEVAPVVTQSLAPAPAEAPPTQPAAVASVNEPTSAAAPSAPSDATATASAAPSADPSTEVVVETDSKDRVSVLVKTRPVGARVLRRGKEIGRTPLTIQIGRGEHRIFEVSMVGFGAKRITLDGEKPEILVNMATEAKPQTVVVPAPAAAPAPMPANKYERLQ